MKYDRPRPRARTIVDDLAAAGRHHFTAEEMRSALGVSGAASKLALGRLIKQRKVASPARGFYVIVPPEYRSLGCLPADQFIPALMEYRKLRYYAALLSAAQYHGAAHHRPQEFQVAVASNRRPISCGSVRASFIARRRIAAVPLQRFNTPRGTILASSPEGTAVDLVGYERRAGGLDNVATVLSELAEHLDPERLLAAARTAPVPWAQRLGYLLELLGAAERAAPLKAHVQRNVRQIATLLPAVGHEHAPRSDAWRLRINVDVEPDW